MMNKAQAVAYGKRKGCRFLVKNSNGGLMGGFTTQAAALKFKAKCEREWANDPWNSGLKFFIETEA